ncbi:hypothetical protein DBV05_g7141 [Lasiodiplodia theobromae]|uniref:NACHT-NTPase and P-loop NTPases N-terminal domain-containing protein n=1 Tax=Lasiodiplodia theobromae TaxID=45133 RepID=A0A5N5D944_9PEZI|nr:hypothetical protein DBV05_g7141 [Lasiodiplodia theobromae]
MSSRFGVGDFLVVGNLCWKLYQNLSQNPSENLCGVRDALGALSNTIRLLNDDIQDPRSLIKQPGQEHRFNLAADIMKNTNNTLRVLQPLVEKHVKKLAMSTRGHRTEYIKFAWNDLVSTKEWRSIADFKEEVPLPSSTFKKAVC